MKTLAFLLGLCFILIGIFGIFDPAPLLGMAHQFDRLTWLFYLSGAIRIVIGLILVAAAPASRTPRALRVLGFVILFLGIFLVLASFVAIDQIRSAIDWWLREGPGFERFTFVVVAVLGGFIAYACAPAKRNPG